MRFNLIYLVFCIVYHLFLAFLCVFLSLGDVQVERSKNKQRVAKRSQKKQYWAKHESMPRHGFIMPQHELIQSKTQGWHAAACQGKAKNKILRSCRSMPKSCRDMMTMINLCYFWQVGFGTPM